MNSVSNTYNEVEESVITDNGTDNISELIVFNDDYNTFDWVIKCFMEVCDHTFEQSEQVALIVHYKGKAVVKTGPLDKLKPLKDSLINRGLSAVIETFKERS